MKKAVLAVLILSIINLCFAKYSGGSGEPNDPYQIANVADLMTLADDANDYNKCFIMTDDIDLDPNLPGNQVFTTAIIAPDTNSSSNGFQGIYFNGVFDGAGHIISNLVIDGYTYLGLFGYIGINSEIKNLGVENVTTNEDCSYITGGLAGRNSGTIRNCFVTGEVKCCEITGGFIGENAGQISNCYCSSNVLCEYAYAGGFCGKNFGEIIKCYSTGYVSGKNEVGGFAGFAYSSSTVSFSFWDVEKSGLSSSACGIGLSTAEMQSSDIYVGWGIDAVWTIDEGNDYPRLVWENKPGTLIAAGYHAGGDGSAENPYLIENPWQLYAIGQLPEDHNKHFLLIEDIDLDPDLFGRWVYDSAIIAFDKDNSNDTFDGTIFTGIFDGGNHRILNLTIDSNGLGSDCLGLFGCTYQGAEIKNLGLENVAIIGGNLSYGLGGIAGYQADGDIKNCFFTGTITIGNHSGGIGGLSGQKYNGNIDNAFSICSINTESSTSFLLGGLVGYNKGGNISKSHCTVVISCKGGSSIGGFVGSFSEGLIIDCFSTGEIVVMEEPVGIGGLAGGNSGDISNSYSTTTITTGYGARNVGGLIGGDSGNINGCYSTGSIDGNNMSFVGGLIGDSGGNVSDCYSTSLVSSAGSSSEVGGLIGHNYGNTKNCYSTGIVIGYQYVGGLIGSNSGGISNSYFLDIAGPDNGYGEPLTDEQMKQQASFIGLDFNDVWHICETTNYPKLLWQLPISDFLCPDGVDFIDYSYLAERWMQADYGDCNGIELAGNGKVDMPDLAILANWWGETGCGDCGGADYSGDNNVNLADLVIFCDNWLVSDYGDVEGAELTGDGVVDLDDLDVFAENWLQ